MYMYIYQIKSLLLSHDHSTCALVSEILESVLQTMQKTIYIQTVHTYRLIQNTMCRIHTHILSTHSVLLDIRTVINTHYTQYVHIINTIVCEKRCNRLYIGRIRNVMDVCWVSCMVSSGSR